MANAALLKGCVIVVLLLAALAVFDLLGDYADNQITGAQIALGETTCADSDADRDYYTKGTVTIVDYYQRNRLSESRFTDFCSSDPADPINTLVEYYCADQDLRLVRFTCQRTGGCKDGACLPNCVLEESKATCVVDEGQSPSVSVGGKLYSISADFVGSTSAKLTVNGEVTPSLMSGEDYVLADSTTLKVIKLTVDNTAGGERLVEFVITTATTLTIKAASFSAVALGAAFGSYYNALDSTCSPEKIFPASWFFAPSTKYYEETGEPYLNTYENIILYDLDSDNKPVIKQNGHREDVKKLKDSNPEFSGKDYPGLATFNWSEAASAWILNEGPECTLSIEYDSLDKSSTIGSVKLAGAANFVSVVPQMIGKTMEQIKGDCNLLGAYSNFGHSVTSAPGAISVQDWDWWLTTHTFAPDELGLGMWLYSDNVCRLSYH